MPDYQSFGSELRHMDGTSSQSFTLDEWTQPASRACCIDFVQCVFSTYYRRRNEQQDETNEPHHLKLLS
jgi:hypothetical protein